MQRQSQSQPTTERKVQRRKKEENWRKRKKTMNPDRLGVFGSTPSSAGEQDSKTASL